MLINQDTLSRRSFWVAGAAAVSTAALGREALAQSGDEPTLKSQFLFSMIADLEPPQDVGDRQIYVAKSGAIDGPRIKGTVLYGGGDWAKKRPDGSTMLDVRATMKTDDGELIYCYYNGIIAQKDSGFYFRTTPYFETKSEKYAWLNTVVAVGVFKPAGANQVGYNIFEIL